MYRTTVIPMGPGPNTVSSAGSRPSTQIVTVTETVIDNLVYTVLDYLSNGIQNGPPDGIALVAPFTAMVISTFG